MVNEAFLTLKHALVNAPVLRLPDFSLEFMMETDACINGVGAVLMQKSHPLAFLSKALRPKNQAFSIYDKECLAIMMALDRWKNDTYNTKSSPYTHTPEESDSSRQS
jgi:hypothetical protein